MDVESSSDEDLAGKKLGDALFTDHQLEQAQKFKQELSQLDKKALSKLIDQESPELRGLLSEFNDSLDQLTSKLQPVLAKAKSGEINPHNKGMTYLEMKYNLLLSYCTFLAFYLLMKVEGREVKGHPVVVKLASIKALLEKLKPLDAKLDYQI